MTTIFQTGLKPTTKSSTLSLPPNQKILPPDISPQQTISPQTAPTLTTKKKGCHFTCHKCHFTRRNHGRQKGGVWKWNQFSTQFCLISKKFAAFPSPVQSQVFVWPNFFWWPYFSDTFEISIWLRSNGHTKPMDHHVRNGLGGGRGMFLTSDL